VQVAASNAAITIKTALLPCRYRSHIRKIFFEKGFAEALANFRGKENMQTLKHDGYCMHRDFIQSLLSPFVFSPML
jgi:hypothetical protein